MSYIPRAIFIISSIKQWEIISKATTPSFPLISFPNFLARYKLFTFYGRKYLAAQSRLFLFYFPWSTKRRLALLSSSLSASSLLVSNKTSISYKRKHFHCFLAYNVERYMTYYFSKST